MEWPIGVGGHRMNIMCIVSLIVCATTGLWEFVCKRASYMR